MNFEEWYNEKFASVFGYENKAAKDLAKESWGNCKREVLKILKDEKNQIVYESYGGFGYKHINPSVLGEIEKL